MNYIWDIVLNARQNGLDESELFFRPAQECSPWYEQSFSVLNETQPGTEIEYNPLYRFDRIFGELLRPDPEGSEEFREKLFDLVTHILVQTDLRHGLSKREYYARRMQTELETGAFGAFVAERMGSVPADKRQRLASLALTQLQTGSSLLLFRKAVKLLFPDALLYQERPTPKRLMLYVGQAKNDAREACAQLIEALFLPIDFELRVFWEHHFGVIGVDSVMALDQIELY